MRNRVGAHHEHPIALLLTFVSMDAQSWKAILPQLPGDGITSPLGLAEDLWSPPQQHVEVTIHCADALSSELSVIIGATELPCMQTACCRCERRREGKQGEHQEARAVHLLAEQLDELCILGSLLWKHKGLFNHVIGFQLPRTNGHLRPANNVSVEYVDSLDISATY